MNGEPEGYEIPIFTSLTQPILMGGVPRSVAILNGTAAILISMPLGLPFIGIPLGITVHAISAYATKRDQYFFDVLKRHISEGTYWD
jgi:type IV secretory pathway TrbD component